MSAQIKHKRIESTFCNEFNPHTKNECQKNHLHFLLLDYENLFLINREASCSQEKIRDEGCLLSQKGHERALDNHSTISEFILLGLSADPHIQALLFVLFLQIYLLTVTGNLMLLLVTRADPHLHTPMYFFLSHLSFLDMCFSSVTVPKLLENLLSQKKTISVKGCLSQVFFLFVSAATEVGLLAAMAYDRFAAICHPLLYGQVMNSLLCKGLACSSWGLGFFVALLNIFPAMNLDFCGDYIIPHYSCELPSLFPLSCSDVSSSFTVLLCSSLLGGLGTCFLIFYSYARIGSTILRIASSSGRRNAFSTCSSHLTAVLLYYGSAFLRYLMPTSGSSLELIFSVQYSVVSSLVNPLIYSLKNNEVKRAVKRILKNISNISQPNTEGDG
ncbi:olfactory receptor 8S1-like [Dasypus novemcinctus]|uniref:olfactory receptor 8S1-like n=1 Tax=Dasypus novemcinctus TaxID=9361 RepID=UPI0039C90F12